MASFTATFIKNQNKNGWYSDHSNNLWLFVGKSGEVKSWKFKGRINGKEIKKTIGYYPDMSLSDARQLAIEIKTSIKNGINYFAELENQKEKNNKTAITFGTLAIEWVELKIAKGIRDNTLKTDRKRLDKHILPILENTHLIDIDKPLLREICDNAKPYTANRIAGMLQNIFEHAVMSDYIDNSPAQYLAKLYPKPKTINNPYLPIEEIAELLTALRMGLQFELIDSVTYRMALIQLHTLSRPTEIATLKWEYIDFDNMSWTIPVEEMKNKETHTQPLSAEVVTLLKEQKPFSRDSIFVFPSARRNAKTPHRNKETVNTALKRLKYQNRLTAHGLRHTGATALAKMGYDRDLIDTALSHFVGNTVSRTYNKDKMFNQRRDMLSHWSTFLDGGAVIEK
ncbi:MAG: tyrosine-type recombinase/integrase [Gammaproteobacteria bacterium]|nr:tyrosine-type recombinase/integrase [Gammaproteobacteria bacterium]